MAVHSSVGEFDQTKESWVSYTKRLDQYFAANDIENAGKRELSYSAPVDKPPIKLQKTCLHQISLLRKHNVFF